MSKLKFTDAIEFDLSGPLRIEEREDGFYVLGEGFLYAVQDLAEGQALILKRQGREVRNPA